MVGNISVSLLVHDKEGWGGGPRTRNDGSIEVLCPDAKNVISSWLYYAFKSVLLSQKKGFELINSKRLKYRSIKYVIFVILVFGLALYNEDTNRKSKNMMDLAWLAANLKGAIPLFIVNYLLY